MTHSIKNSIASGEGYTQKLTELWGMTTHREEDSPSAQALRAAVDSVIVDTLERDPARVARALEEVVERCKLEARYPVDEIDRAAAQLRHELGIRPKLN